MERKQLIIKQLRILSVTEKAAKSITFDPRRNLITGENDVGKSSIIKSIYHTLGADVHFDDIWSKAEAIGLLYFSLDDQNYQILRARNHFGFFDGQGKLIKAFEGIISGLSPFLSDFFGNKLKLKSSNSMGRISVSPAIQLLPHYIDQDKSWSRAWDSFDGLGVYSSYRKELLEFFTGIKPNEWYLAQAKIDSVKAKYADLQIEVNALISARGTVAKHMPKATFDVDVNAFKRDISKLLIQLEALKFKEDEYRRNLIKLKSQESFFDNEISVLEKSIKEINKDYEYSITSNEDEVVCPTCNAVYENSMISRFSLLDDVDMCRKLLAEHIEDKKEVRKKLAAAEAQINLLRPKVTEISALLDEKRGRVRLKDFIQNESSRRVKEIFDSSESDYAAKLYKLECDEERLKEERARLNNKDRKDSIVSRFNTLIDLFFIKLDVQTLNSSGFGDIPLTVKSQGSDTPRALLAYYYAILLTSAEFTSLPLFPLIIDSPNQQDQDPANRKRIIQFIFDNTPENQQLILGTVDLHGAEYKGPVVSPLTKMKLLKSDEFEENYAIIMPLLDRVHEQLLKKSGSMAS